MDDSIVKGIRKTLKPRRVWLGWNLSRHQKTPCSDSRTSHFLFWTCRVKCRDKTSLFEDNGKTFLISLGILSIVWSLINSIGFFLINPGQQEWKDLIINMLDSSRNDPADSTYLYFVNFISVWFWDNLEYIIRSWKPEISCFVKTVRKKGIVEDTGPNLFALLVSLCQ